MSLLLRSSTKLFRNSAPFLAKRYYCEDYRYWRPGPPPKTQEEHEAAARKYNLIPEDYEPFPDDEGMGDYPKLPWASEDSRDPYEMWDHYYARRNFGEPLNIFHKYQSSEVCDMNEELNRPEWKVHGFTLFFSSLLVFLAFLDYYFDLRFSLTRKPKQYPGPGKVHYTI